MTPIESVDAAVHQELWVTHRIRTLILATISIFAGCLGVVGFFLYVNTDLIRHPDLLASLSITVALLAQLPNILVRSRIRVEFFKQIAASLGLSFTGTAPISTVSGQLFAFGHSRSLSEVFEGMHSGHALRMFRYRFVTGSGKHQTTHAMQIFETDCKTELPELMVRPKSVTPGGMTWQPEGTRPLRLEGLFNEKYDVYVKDGMEIEALQVLEPHHMDTLMQQYQDIGLYTHATKLYVFTDNALPTTRTDFMNLIALIDELYDALVPELDGVSDDVTALREAFSRAR